MPTPWPKEEFEQYSKQIQQRRRDIRAANRPEAEMDALFQEERSHEIDVLGRGRYAARVGAFEGGEL